MGQNLRLNISLVWQKSQCSVIRGDGRQGAWGSYPKLILAMFQQFSSSELLTKGRAEGFLLSSQPTLHHRERKGGRAALLFILP